MKINKRLLPIVLLSLITSFLHSQEHNKYLLDSLENIYKAGCIKTDIVKYKPKYVANDKKMILILNSVYRLKHVSEIKETLLKSKFQDESKSLKDSTVQFFFKHTGYIRSFVYIRKLGKNSYFLSFKIATDRKFFCKTDSSSNMCYIDFVYLKHKLSNIIHFPLKMAQSNVELETDSVQIQD